MRRLTGTAVYSTMQDYPLTITSLLRYGTEIHADRLVITAKDDGFREISYGQFGDRVSQLANGLCRLGVRPGDRVATFMWNNQEHLEAYFAIPCMGAVLHTLNIRLSDDQIEFVAYDAEDKIIIVDMSLAEQLAPVLPRMETVHTVVAVGDGVGADAVEMLGSTGKEVVRYDDLIGGEPIGYPWPVIDERSAAAMCYTSGTTGHPKGVVYGHRSTYLHSTAVCSTNGMTLGEGDRALPVVPMFHANGWGIPHAALLAGADLLLPDCHAHAPQLIDMIEARKPTFAAAVPTIWNDVLHCLEADPSRDISSLRLIICGGSAVPESLMRAYQDKLGVTLMQLWGMTETSPLASLARPPQDTPSDEGWQLRATAGRPLFGVEMRIVDDDGNALPKDGESVGELEVRGPWVTGAYYRGRDAERFTGGWLRTGDVGKMNRMGYVTLTDRAKDVIKSGGEWISSVELENHIMGHPAVLEAAVVGVPDERWQERPLAAVVVKEGAVVTAAELRNFLRDKVVRWWLPERWTFVDEVPRTSVGKFNKKVIREQYADNAYEVIECRD